MVDLPVQFLSWQTVIGDSIAKHAAQFLSLLKNRHLVSHKGEIISRTDTSRTASYNSYLLSCSHRRYRKGNISCMIYCKSFQSSDIYRIIYHGPAAPYLAGMFTDQAADCRKGIILSDQPHRIPVPALCYQSYITGNIHSRRTLGYTGNRLVQFKFTSSS